MARAIQGQFNARRVFQELLATEGVKEVEDGVLANAAPHSALEAEPETVSVVVIYTSITSPSPTPSLLPFFPPLPYPFLSQATEDESDTAVLVPLKVRTCTYLW